MTSLQSAIDALTAKGCKPTPSGAGYIAYLDNLANDVRYALKQFPLLTYFGFGDFGKPLVAPPELRNQLLSDHALHEINLSQHWLGCQIRIKTISRHYSSYGLKHVVENCTPRPGCPRSYVANGSFIVAAIIDGWKVRRCSPTSPNAWLNISRNIRRPVLEVQP